MKRLGKKSFVLLMCMILTTVFCCSGLLTSQYILGSVGFVNIQGLKNGSGVNIRFTSFTKAGRSV